MRLDSTTNSELIYYAEHASRKKENTDVGIFHKPALIMLKREQMSKRV